MLIEVVIEIASDLQLRAGDATYVAVAHQLNLPLVTWDKEQLQRGAILLSTYTPLPSHLNYLSSRSISNTKRNTRK